MNAISSPHLWRSWHLHILVFIACMKMFTIRKSFVKWLVCLNNMRFTGLHCKELGWIFIIILHVTTFSILYIQYLRFANVHIKLVQMYLFCLNSVLKASFLAESWNWNFVYIGELVKFSLRQISRKRYIHISGCLGSQHMYVTNIFWLQLLSQKPKPCNLHIDWKGYMYQIKLMKFPAQEP